MSCLLGEIKVPLARFYGVRDRLSTGNGLTDVAVAFVFLAIVFLIGYVILSVIHRRQNRTIRCPRRLFQEMLHQLPLNVAQRDMLRGIARDLRLPHPAVLVLSPQVFRNHANRWMSLTRSANRQTLSRLTQLAAALFPASASEAESANHSPV